MKRVRKTKCGEKAKVNLKSGFCTCIDLPTQKNALFYKKG